MSKAPKTSPNIAQIERMESAEVISLLQSKDVAIDALAVGTLPPEERGLVNGLMFAGSYLGQTVGGAGVLFLASYLPFNTTFPFVCVGILAVTLGISIWLREARRAIPLEEAELADATPAALRVLNEVLTYVVTALKAMFGSVRAAAGLIFALLPAGVLLGGADLDKA